VDALKLLSRLCPEHMVRNEREGCFVDLESGDGEQSMNTARVTYATEQNGVRLQKASHSRLETIFSFSC